MEPRNLSLLGPADSLAYLSASDILLDEGCGGLLQRVLQERERGGCIPEAQ
jgi:hypothetical protein